MQRKKMVKIGVLALGAALLGGAGLGVRAVADATAGLAEMPRPGMVLERIQRELKLTDEQKVQIKAILAEAVPQAKTIHDDMTLKPDAKKAKLQALRDATKSKIAAVLTDEQQKKLVALKAQAPQRIQQALATVAEKLELTPEQKTQIQPILADAFTQGKAIVEDMTLTLAQKRVKLQKLHDDTKSQVDPLLTPAQRSKLEAMRGQWLAALRQRLQANLHG